MTARLGDASPAASTARRRARCRVSVAPRATRWVAAILTALLGSDLLQIAPKKAEDAI